jgi:hypothetical protein
MRPGQILDLAWHHSVTQRLGIDQAVKRLGIQNFHMALIHFDNTIVYKLGECAADGF